MHGMFSILDGQSIPEFKFTSVANECALLIAASISPKPPHFAFGLAFVGVLNFSQDLFDLVGGLGVCSLPV